MSNAKSACTFLVLACAVAGAALLALETVLPHEPEPRPIIHLNLKFEERQIVDLKIGGKGQIISVRPQDAQRPYGVKIRISDGTKTVWLNEWELEECVLP
jgi:hypothetical protein